MEQPKKYTCIKPTVIQSTKITIGDQVALVDSQARPLKNGGFITFDEEAAKCIRQLAQKDEDEQENIVSSEEVLVTEVGEGDANTHSDEHPTTLQQSPVGYEKGD